MAASPKVIAVTGASRGIGAAIALELRRRGHVVGRLARSSAGPDPAGEAPTGGRFIDIACDVTRESSVKDALAKLAQAAGTINGLVNNAGILRDGTSHELPTATYEEVMATNATAAFV